MISGTVANLFFLFMFPFLFLSVLHAHSGKSRKYIQLERTTVKTLSCSFLFCTHFPFIIEIILCIQYFLPKESRNLPQHKYIFMLFRTFKCSISYVYIIIYLAISLMLDLILFLIFHYYSIGVYALLHKTVNISMSKD